MIKAVLFDLDGTLLDTSKDLAAALNAVRQHNNLKPLSHAQIRPHVSNGANALLQCGFGDLDPPTQEQYRLQLLDYYLQNIATQTEAFDGINQLLDELHHANIPWGIVTNKPKIYTRALLSQYSFMHAPAAVICPEDVNNTKPSPEGLLKACHIINCQPPEAVYVGDHIRDIEAGKNAGMQTIAVGYGFTDTPSCHLSWGADYTVQHAHQIIPIIRSIL
ncbi:MAG: HAD-IA family hydrolase [Marinagarivorans sp.]|nr:HAD-IA family hydrolase [Marinagarivorans sp.]